MIANVPIKETGTSIISRIMEISILQKIQHDDGDQEYASRSCIENSATDSRMNGVVS